MIGLTGGIASGKSTVSDFLRELGAKVLDADGIAREVVLPGELGWRRVKSEFPQVINEDQTIDRQKLGELIFNDKEEKEKLEGLLHPIIIDMMQTEGKRLEEAGFTVVADIPLLFETNCQEWLSVTWLVYVDYKTQLKRLKLRDKLSDEQAKARIASQMPLDEKVKLADKVIDNRFARNDTRAQVIKLWRGLNR